jgi:hypothetical protein
MRRFYAGHWRMNLPGGRTSLAGTGRMLSLPRCRPVEQTEVRPLNKPPPAAARRITLGARTLDLAPSGQLGVWETTTAPRSGAQLILFLGDPTTISVATCRCGSILAASFNVGEDRQRRGLRTS